MNCSTHSHSPEAIAEIERHKYFLSEKAGYDVGWEFAEQDWLSNHCELNPSPSEEASDMRSASDAQSAVPAPKGLGTILKRLLSKVRVL